MCLIIERPAGVTIPRWLAEVAADMNSHGCGLMWADGRRVIVRRSVRSHDAARLLADAPADRTVWVHWRLATAGRVDVANCHPVTPEGVSWALMHNGIFPGWGDRDESDTVQVARELAALFGEDAHCAEAREALEFSAAGSRVVILSPSGRVTRIGGWHRMDGLLLSNLTCLRYAPDWVTPTVAQRHRQPQRRTPASAASLASMGVRR